MKLELGATVEIPFRVKQVADMLGVSLRVVRLWISTGKLKATQPVKNGIWLIYKKDLDEFLKTRKTKKRQK